VLPGLSDFRQSESRLGIGSHSLLSVGVTGYLKHGHVLCGG
jgi:hypothetical protein